MFLRPNFVVLSLGVHSERMRTSCRQQKFDQWSAITRKRCQIGCKLVLITNRKLHMGFRLVPKLVTLNDLERRNGPPNSVAFGADCVKIVEDRPILSLTDKSVAQSESIFNDISFMAIFAEVIENECIIDEHVRDIYFTIHCEDRVQHIEMSFAPYGRVMLDARCLCGRLYGWASCFLSGNRPSERKTFLIACLTLLTKYDVTAIITVTETWLHSNFCSNRTVAFRFSFSRDWAWVIVKPRIGLYAGPGFYQYKLKLLWPSACIQDPASRVWETRFLSEILR